MTDSLQSLRDQVDKLSQQLAKATLALDALTERQDMTPRTALVIEDGAGWREALPGEKGDAEVPTQLWDRWYDAHVRLMRWQKQEKEARRDLEVMMRVLIDREEREKEQ